FQAEDGIRDLTVTGVQTCALPIFDDMLAEAHNSLAHVCMHDFNWPEAEQAFRRAIELSPNNSTAHQWYAFYLLFHQQNEAAIRRSEERRVGKESRYQLSTEYEKKK